MATTATSTKAQTFDDQLESLIDHTSLYNVLKRLENICILKADHIRENWQPHGEYSARVWDAASRKIGRIKVDC